MMPDKGCDLAVRMHTAHRQLRLIRTVRRIFRMDSIFARPFPGPHTLRFMIRRGDKKQHWAQP